jgi:hypothetical protein
MRRNPYRELQGLTDVETAIVEAILRLGNPEEARLRADLDEQGVELIGGFDRAMRRLRSKGWVRRTDWKWHFTTAAVHHMR